MYVDIMFFFRNHPKIRGHSHLYRNDHNYCKIDLCLETKRGIMYNCINECYSQLPFITIFIKTSNIISETVFIKLQKK